MHTWRVGDVLFADMVQRIQSDVGPSVDSWRRSAATEESIRVRGKRGERRRVHLSGRWGRGLPRAGVARERIAYEN